MLAQVKAAKNPDLFGGGIGPGDFRPASLYEHRHRR
jgi:hypothetical protein